jgi:hypothetical protein
MKFLVDQQKIYYQTIINMDFAFYQDNHEASLDGDKFVAINFA